MSFGARPVSLSVVPEADAWCIFDHRCDPLPLMSSPAEALAHFILHPQLWSDSPEFWLALGDGGGMSMDTLGLVVRGQKRPSFSCLRGLCWSRHNGAGPFSHIDFWFLGKLIDQLSFEGIRFLQVGEQTRDFTYLQMLPSMSDLAKHIAIRRRADWKTNHPQFTNPFPADWLGVHRYRGTGYRENYGPKT